jgi:gas vesicle protein
VTRFLIGLGVGIGLGIIFAPAKGSQTRARLREKAEEVADLPRKKLLRWRTSAKTKPESLGLASGDRAPKPQQRLLSRTCSATTRVPDVLTAARRPVGRR